MANVSKLNLLGNVYNITDKEAQNKIAELEAKVDTIETPDLSAYETKVGAASKYQPKGEYLTEHQDISGLATKEDTYNKEYIDGVVTTVSTQLNSKLPIDSFNEWSETVATKEEVSEKVDKVNGKGLSTNDYTTADKNTVANLKQLSSISHIKDNQAFTATSTGVKLNFDCVSASAGDGNYTQHSIDVPVASATSAGVITSADKAKIDATPTFWVGTQAEYDALPNKDTGNTFYYIVEE